MEILTIAQPRTIRDQRRKETTRVNVESKKP
jgi:hypothetical protein